MGPGKVGSTIVPPNNDIDGGAFTNSTFARTIDGGAFTNNTFSSTYNGGAF